MTEFEAVAGSISKFHVLGVAFLLIAFLVWMSSNGKNLFKLLKDSKIDADELFINLGKLGFLLIIVIITVKYI